MSTLSSYARSELTYGLASLALLGVYHAHLYGYEVKRSTASSRRQMAAIRRGWTATMQNTGMVPVNTIRDYQRSMFYFGNNAVLLSTLIVSCSSAAAAAAAAAAVRRGIELVAAAAMAAAPAAAMAPAAACCA